MSNNSYPYLKDPLFLKEIDSYQNKEQHIKITVLNKEEEPIELIQGKVRGGSINLDANSSVRRTCNPSILVDDYEKEFLDLDSLFSMNKKIYVEIGYTNVFSSYPSYRGYNIIWFPLGVFIIVNSNCTHSKEGLNISLQLKDKMCLLNGECGGVIPAATTFHEVEEWSDIAGNYVTKSIKIYDIILELVNHLGGELLDRIIINDLPSQVQQLVRWNGNDPVYIGSVGVKTYMSMNYQDVASFIDETLKKENITNTKIEDYIETYHNGYDLGYFYTDFTYPGELICNAGETVCNVLDKIKNTLGNFEYYYDVYGNFVFQEIKNYLNTSRATEILNKIKDGLDYEVEYWNGGSSYDFTDSILVSSYSSNPQYGQIKNDFVIWGKRKDATGSKTLPIRYHLAIDKKPKTGNTYTVYVYLDRNESDDKDPGVKRAKWIVDTNSDNYKAKDVSVIYKDLNGEYFEYDATIGEFVSVSSNNVKKITTYDWRSELYFSALRDMAIGEKPNDYAAEITVEWPKIYNIEYMGEDDESTQNGFYKQVIQGTGIDYFLDFIDVSAEKGKYCVEAIGRRSKVVSDEKINCIFEPALPEIVFINVTGNDFDEEESEEEIKKWNNQNIRCISASPLRSWIIGGGYFNSAYVLLQDLLYQMTDFNETISISSIPIYYLEPNTRITVNDRISGINGYYMIKSFSVPLDGKGSMTLSCIKALER